VISELDREVRENEPINGETPALTPPRPTLMRIIPIKNPGRPAPASKDGGKDVMVKMNAPVT
jgi:hypothetical protein